MMYQFKTFDELELMREQRIVEDIDEPMRKAICPDCGSKEFIRSVAYELYQFINEKGNIRDEDWDTWSISIESSIRCCQCDRNCNDLFGKEIYPNWQLEVL